MLKLIIILLICTNIIVMYLITKIKHLNKPFFRFVLTGGLNTLIYYLIYLYFYQNIKLIYIESHLIAFLGSAFISFFLTTYYTFKSKPTYKKFIKFPLTFLPNLIISTVLTFLLVDMLEINKTYASLIAMIISIPITFIISKKIIKD